jgi:hypothetical protein
MNYGYARVSTDDQNSALQLELEALKRAEYKPIFKDEGLSGATTEPCTRSKRFEVQHDLLLALRMLLSPQFQQQRRHCREHDSRPVNLGVATRAKRNHQVELRNTRHAVMHEDRSLAAAGCSADTAAILVPLQNLFAQAAKVFLVLAFEGVTGRIQPKRMDLRSPTRAAKRPLDCFLHSSTPWTSISIRSHG